MRLLINLEASKDCVYDLKYHSKLQGFIYNLMKNSPYEHLHNSKESKLFCFSNIFPAEDMKKGDKRNLVVSSPVRKLIKQIEGELVKIQGEDINIGEMSFILKSIKTLNPKIEKNCKLITGTPIVVRIPKKRFEEYGINSDKDYIYWDHNISLEPFMKQLEDDLLKKFIRFHGLDNNKAEKIRQEAFPLFQMLKAKGKSKGNNVVCNHLIIEGHEVKVLGSLWEFEFQNLTKQQQKILQVGLDTGFGERTSYGFGFMNLVK